LHSLFSPINTLNYKLFLKKLVAIVLLGAHLFTLGGYAFVFDYLMHRSDVEIVKQMYDNKKDAVKLLEIKIPVNMPTIQDWPEYEHIEGQIQLNGAYYNYVRLKMTRDTMSLICLANTTKANLAKTNIIIAKDFNDVPLSKKGAQPLAKKVTLGYDNVYQVIKCDYKPYANVLRTSDQTKTFSLEHPYIESPGKPPNAFC